MKIVLYYRTQASGHNRKGGISGGINLIEVRTVAQDGFTVFGFDIAKAAIQSASATYFS